MTEKQSNWQKWLMVVLLAIGGGTIFKAMYLREVFYYPWNEFMGVNNTESGLLMGWLGLVGVISGAVAGPLIDKINNTRYTLCAAFIGMGAVTLWQATAPSLGTQYVVIALLSFLGNGLYLIGMIRATRLLGDSKDQGRLFGFLESGRGIAGSIVSATAVTVFGMYAIAIEGVESVLRAYGFLYLALGVIFWFLLPKEDRKREETTAKTKISAADVLQVLKVKEVWMAAISIFATISFYQGSSYMVPYLTDAYGMSVEQAGWVGMIRAYVLAIAVAPIVGLLADRVGSAIKVMNWLFILGAIGVGTFLVIPQNPEMVWVLIAMLMLVGSVNFALRGIMYAQLEEMKVPARLTGTVMGVMATVGFSPEIFIPSLFGWWLEAYQMTGYTYMFMFMCGAFIVGIGCSFALFRCAPTAFARFDLNSLNNIKGQVEAKERAAN